MGNEMDTAYSALQVKAITEDAEYVYVSGIASTPTIDRVGDSINPLGARFRTPMPLLVGHDHSRQVGHVMTAKPSKAGIPFDARLPVVKEEGELKSMVDKAIHALKYKLLGFVSVGFKPVEGKTKFIDSGYYFEEWNWMELSLCAIPANPDAIITSVKSLDYSKELPRDVIDELKRYNFTPSGGPVRLLQPKQEKTAPLPGGAVRLITPQ